MGRIHALPQALITAIAAGEVAERPAIILKELLENSLDAGATSIEVELHQAGLRFLRVTDNGCGMTAAELLLSIQRHTTSKISRLADLERITSFGFRGEALASITAAADVQLISRPANQAHATSIKSYYGEVGTAEPIAGAPGTTIIVQYPFAHLPARRKFLNDSSREWRAIAQVLTQLVIAHPEVSWHITHNHRPIWHLPVSEPFDRLIAVAGIDQPQLITTVQHQADWLQIAGWIGHPQLARTSQNTQFLYVNKRPFTWPIANRRIKSAFGQLLENRLEPFFILNLELSPGLVDVNVHPQKTTVKFMDEPQMLALIQSAVAETLHRAYTQDQPVQVIVHPLKQAAMTEQRLPEVTNRLPASAVTSQALEETVHELPTLLTQLDQHEIWQFDKTYLVTMTKTGVLLIDQHAAHERVLYEQLRTKYLTKDHLSSFALTTACILTLDLRDAQILTEHLEELQQLGFAIEAFGSVAFQVSAVPELLQDRDPETLLKELLDDLDEGKPISLADSAAERTIAYLSCRNAVKAGDVLEPRQRLELIRQLSQCEHPHSCPHGRPTSITLTVAELEKRFHRS